MIVGYLQIKGWWKVVCLFFTWEIQICKPYTQNMNRFKSTLWASICSHSLGIEYVSINVWEVLPSAQHVSQVEESRIVNRLGKNISTLLSSGNVLDIDIPFWIVGTTYPASEMVVFDCNVFSSRSELQGLSHCNCRKIIFMYRQAKVCWWKVQRKNAVDFLWQVLNWNGFSERVR